MAQEHQQRNPQKNKAEETQDSAPEAVETNVDDEEIDDLLAEIDEVLEENAQAFVEGYIQKGGQ